MMQGIDFVLLVVLEHLCSFFINMSKAVNLQVKRSTTCRSDSKKTWRQIPNALQSLTKGELLGSEAFTSILT